MVALAFAGAAGAMLADWWAVVRPADRVEAVAKPLVMVALIGAVLASDVVTAGSGRAVLVALVLAGLGDLLLLPQVDRFVPGLLAFVGTHLGYLVAFVAAGVTPALLVVGALISTLATVGIGRAIVAGATRRDLRLGRAVVFYIVVLSAMWTAAIAVGDVLAIIGATLFVASDAVLGWNRFVAGLSSGRLLTHVPYHVGQALLVGWAVSGG